MKIRQHNHSSPHPAPCIPHPPRSGFTLVELLVVITIIGILAALITVAAVGALKAARQTQIKVEIDQIAGGLEEVKNKTTAYPPNCQTDAAGPLVEADVLNDLRRYIQMIASKWQEKDDLARVLTGQTPSDTTNYPRPLAGGISASEAVVFWLGGSSSDPKFPISGDGGPSYSVVGISAADRRKADPIENRTWTYPVDVTRLGPRASDGYFDESKGRYLEYTDPKGVLRRINFWEYYPSKSEEPFVYFDTSRHPVGKVSGANLVGSYDPPGATYTGAGNIASVYAFKKALETVAPATAPQIQFINPDKFQVFHCGIDGAWDKSGFTSMSPGTGKTNTAVTYVLFPTGPYVGEFADTQVSFSASKTIEDAQK